MSILLEARKLVQPAVIEDRLPPQRDLKADIISTRGSVCSDNESLSGRLRKTTRSPDRFRTTSRYSDLTLSVLNI